MRLLPRLLLLLTGFLIWTCDVSDSKKKDSLTFHVNDSLMSASGKYDSIRLDLYAIEGKDTVFTKTLFHGAYTSPDQLKDLSLGDAPSRFVIKVTGFCKGDVAFVSGVPFADGKQEGPVLVYQPAKPIINHPPTLSLQPTPTSGGIRIKEGETVSFLVSVQDPDDRDKTVLLPLSASKACGAALDPATGKLSIKPSFQCVVTGDSTVDSLVLRVVDNASPPDSARLALRFSVLDSNSAPRWAASSHDLSGKEGKPFDFDFSSFFLGDAEGDSVSLASSCGMVDRKSLHWSFTPGFRDAGNLECDLVASDSHSPPVSSKLALHLSIADSVRLVDVAIISPVRGIVTKDSVVSVVWKIGDVAQMQDTTERLKAEGTNWIKRSFRDSLGNFGVDSVNVILDMKPPAKPLVHLLGTSPTNLPKPTWTWGTGGNGGSGSFQYKLDDSNFVAGASVASSDTAFTPASNLKEGTHTLYVRERDSVGNWSSYGSAAVIIDQTPPADPVLTSTAFHTTKPKPVWQWYSGGNGGNGTFRYKLDDGDFTSGATLTQGTSFTPSISFASGTKHTLYVQERDDAGNWSGVSSYCVHVHGEIGYAAGSNGAIFRTSNAGVKWDTVQRTSNADLWSLWFKDENNGILVGDSGTITKTSDGGLHTQPISISTKARLTSIFFTSGNAVLATSGDGEIFKSVNGGNSWSLQPSESGRSLFSIDFLDSLNGIGVGFYSFGTRGAIRITGDGGKTWVTPLEDAPYGLLSSYWIDQKTIICVGNSGSIIRTTDGGITWNEMTSGTSKYLCSVFFINPQVGFVSGEGGTLLKSSDGGIHWNPVSSGTSEFIYTLFFTDEKTGYAAGDNATFLKTTDGGGTWSVVTKIASITWDGAFGEHVLVYPAIHRLFFP